MRSRLSLRLPLPHVVLALLGSIAVLCCLAARADASVGAYRVLLTESYPSGPHELGAQIATFSDVASIDYADTSASTPTAAQLAPYDVVVSVGDSSYLDREAWGNSLAAYLDGGGVVVQAGYDSWEDAFPMGRFESGAYAPFIPGNNGNLTTSLGAFDASSPLMQGIATLTTEDNTEPELAPGATLIAKWANDKNAIAMKGRVVTTTAWIGDDYGPGLWSGDYGRLVVNAVRTLGPQRLTVTNSTPAGGTVASSASGISCGTVCSAEFTYQTPVGLAATANKGFAFAGFSGACTGVACSLTMDAAKAVTASFTSVKFVKKKAELNKKKGTALVSVTLGGPGKVVVSGKKTKKRSKTAKAAGTLKMPIVAKGKALAALKSKGKAKVKFNLAFTPPGGTTATLTKSVVLRLAG